MVLALQRVVSVRPAVTFWTSNRPIPNRQFRVLSVLSRIALQRALGVPVDWTPAIPEHGIPAVHTVDDLVSVWPTVRAVLGVLYFFCEADGHTLRIDDRGALRLNLFVEHLAVERRGRGIAPTLAFLNGCMTAVGLADGGFLESLSEAGYIGFVGTEARVPDSFALMFGAEFLTMLLRDGIPIGQVLDTLRTRHWPLSLLYSVYRTGSSLR